MEIVYDSSWSDNGKEMFAVVPFVDIAFSSNNADVIFHLSGVTGRKRLAGYEGFAGSGRRTRGK